MRFKVFYDEKINSIKINVLIDMSTDIILPENLDQSLHYPIPNELKKEIQKTVQNLIEEEDSQCIGNIDKDIANLVEKRKDTIKEMRKKYNPKIMKYCEDYKINFPEWFI